MPNPENQIYQNCPSLFQNQPYTLSSPPVVKVILVWLSDMFMELLLCSFKKFAVDVFIIHADDFKF